MIDQASTLQKALCFLDKIWQLPFIVILMRNHTSATAGDWVRFNNRGWFEMSPRGFTKEKPHWIEIGKTVRVVKKNVPANDKIDLRFWPEYDLSCHQKTKLIKQFWKKL